MRTAARKFEPQMIRSGGLPTRISFNIQCSSCSAEETISGTSKLPDEVVEKKFKQKGWLLGRSRIHDLCPICIKVAAKNRLADKYKVSEGGSLVPTTIQVVEAAEADRNKRAQNAAAIWDKVFGSKNEKVEKPKESVAEEGTEAMPEQPTSGDLSEVTEQLTQIKAAGELNIELLDKIVTAQGQQITAIERMTTTLARQNETIINALLSLERAVSRLGRPSALPMEDAPQKEAAAPQPLPEALLLLPPGFGKVGKVETGAPKPCAREASEQKPIAARAPSRPDPEPTSAAKPAKPAKSVGKPVKSKPVLTDTVRVASYPNGSQISSSIRVARSVWDEVGMTDRVTIARNGNELVLKADANGIKIKKINTQSVYLQTKRLGDVDFDVAEVKTKKGELRVIF